MNKRLQEALELVKTWPDKRQEEAAYALFAMQEQDAAVLEFDDEDRKRLERSLAQARQREFAAAEEVAAVRKKHGL